MADIEIEIDGKPLKTTTETMVIQVADEAGIYIPRFCYHKHLSVAANCRMCLVEVEKVGKPAPACATPCTPGMKVFTKSQKALAAQKAVMEFLLINHPLDCPICDQGGECELQDLAMGFGGPKSFFNEGKRSVKDKDIGPLIETEMTRCIQCTRCVRFGAEVAGMRELGATGRGEDMEIGTYIEHAMKSEVSGNVIDICPVGALTSKPFRFTARAWELEQRATLSSHDCLGSNLYAHVRRGKVMRMVPRENDTINETWISDRDRFSYEGLYHEDRVTKPLIKKNNIWHEVSWQAAIEFAAGRLKTIASQDATQIGALASPNATLEEMYLMQKLLRSLGSSNIDHRLRQVDFSDDSVAGYPTLGMTLTELEACDTLLLIGSNIQKDQPSASLRIRKAVRRGAKVMALNPYDYNFHFDLTEKVVTAPDDMVAQLASILKALNATEQQGMDNAVAKAIAHCAVKDSHQAIAKCLQEGKKVGIVLGNIANQHPQASVMRTLAKAMATCINAQWGQLTDGANAAGGWLAGAVPYRGVSGAKEAKPGRNAKTMFDTPLRAYLLLDVEPELDCANPIAAITALQQAEFVVSLSQFRNPIIDECAQVILPIATFVEKSGTFVSAAGQWQTFHGVAAPFAESRPAWKILRVIGNVLDFQGFDFESSEEIHHLIKTAVHSMQTTEFGCRAIEADELNVTNEDALFRVGTIPIYAVDSVVRRARALQSAQPAVEGMVTCVRLHPSLAQELQVKEGEVISIKQKQGKVRLPVKLDARTPKRAVVIAAGIPETNGLSELFGQVELKKG